MSAPAEVAAPPLHLGRVPSLDGIRAAAVLMVMAYHARIPGFDGGNTGVDVFFVLSGFLITVLLLSERSRNGSIGLGAFYMRRALRLYPALVAGVLFSIALAALKMPLFNASSTSLRSTLEMAPFSLLYTANIPRALDWNGGGFLGHTWSLAIEEQFYLVWPLVVIWVMGRRTSAATLGWIALACAVTSAALRAGLDLAGFRSEGLYNATFTHVDGIFAGCALAVVWVMRPDLLAKFATWWLSLAAFAVSAIVVVHGQNMNVYGFAVVVVSTLVLLCHLLVRSTSPMSELFSHRALVAIGQRSYGLYLYHWPIFLFLGLDLRLHVLALGFGGSFAVAWLSYAYIEVPFLRMKRRWDTAR